MKKMLIALGLLGTLAIGTQIAWAGCSYNSDCESNKCCGTKEEKEAGDGYCCDPNNAACNEAKARPAAEARDEKAPTCDLEDDANANANANAICVADAST
jgi:hypothetical protein